MFDVGFSEMIVIAVVALVVIGPEKLPRVARTVGALLGRMQRYVNDVKADINREIELDELRKMHTSVKEAAQDLHSSVKDAVSSFEAHGKEMNEAIAGESGKLDAPMSDADLAKAIEDAQTEAVLGPTETSSGPATAEPQVLEPEPVSAVAPVTTVSHPAQGASTPGSSSAPAA